jgi:DNA-binding response OmpR family regulator
MSRTARVLVVDDETLSCERCSEVLGNAGCEVSTTSDPAHGLELAGREPYDFVLVDAESTSSGAHDYLRSVRERAPRASIIVLADRPSVDEAVRSMKEGASDYLIKPLEPHRLLSAVQRGMKEASVHAPPPRTGPLGLADLECDTWHPGSHELMFRDDVWMQAGLDGSRRLGLSLTRRERATARVEALVKRGGSVREGLPFAEVGALGGDRRVLLAPMDGVVLEVRPSPIFDAGAADARPHEDWLVRILPMESALPPCLQRRHLVCLDPDRDSLEGLTDTLRGMGLAVHAAASPKQAMHALHCSRCDTLLINGASMGADGPEQLLRILSAMPGTRAVVLGDRTGAWEGHWRRQGIAYYAAAPLDLGELHDLFAGLYRSKPAAFERQVRPHHHTPPWIRGIETTNGRGRRIMILASNTTLPAEQGVGLHLVNTLLNHCRPITTRFGAKALDADTVASCLADWDRVLVLRCGVGDGVPGSLVETASLAPELGVSGDERVLGLTFQGDPEQPVSLSFCDRTNAAIANYIHRCIEGL